MNLKNLKTSLILLSTAFFLFSCATKKQNTGSVANNKEVSKTVTEKYIALAQEKFKTHLSYQFNADSSFVLCIQDKKGTAKMPQNQLKFFVYDLKNEKVTYEKSVGAGTVKWYDKEYVEIFILPGIMAKDQTRDDYTTLYNVRTNKSINKRVFLSSEKQ